MRQALDVIHEPLRRLIRCIRAVEPEFYQQETATLRKQLEVRGTLFPKSVHDRAFESLQADWLERENLGDMIGGGKRVAVAKRNESPMLRARDQLQLGFEHNRAGPLGPDKRPGNVEASLREELVEVVAGDSPGNVRIALAYLRRVSISNPPQPVVDFAAASPRVDDRVELAVVRSADGQLGAVVKQDAELFDVVDRLASKQTVGAAGVVADHPAERAAAVGCRIRSERQVKRLGSIPKGVQHHSRLNAREPLARIDLEDLVHVLREVQHDRDVAALAGEARPRATGQHGGSEFPAGG